MTRLRSHLQKGMSLVECLTTLAVVLLVAAIGWPTLTRVLDSRKLEMVAQRTVHGLWLARSRAITVGARVSICPTSDHVACRGDGAWNQGWMVFVDGNADGERQGSEEVLWNEASLGDGWAMRANANILKYISYDTDGRSKLTSGGFQAGTLTICRSASAAGSAMMAKVVISATGRPRIESDREAAACPVA